MSFIFSLRDHQPTDLVTMETSKQRTAPGRMRGGHCKLLGSGAWSSSCWGSSCRSGVRGWAGRSRTWAGAERTLPPPPPASAWGFPGRDGGSGCRAVRTLPPAPPSPESAGAGVRGGWTSSPGVFSQGDLTRGEARPGTTGLSCSLGHTSFNPLAF